MSGRACIVSCSDHYDHRLRLWDSQLQALGYSTQYITSDFDHNTKERYSCKVPGCIQISVLPYRKNLSVQRILSHRQFAKRTAVYLEKERPDVVVALLPPNFLSKYLAAYKRRHPQVKLFFDIFDLWPETFPSGRAKQILAPAFRIWASLRDRNLPAADFVTTECDLFRSKLKLGSGSKTVPFSAEPSPVSPSPALPGDMLSLCYLGAINNVIDIPRICAFLQDAVGLRPVRLHIIGKGERQQEFIDSAKAAGAEVIFHGAVYDAAEKQRIMDSCHFGINIFKESVCIGLSMKSVDYFRHGLPILNSIPADTARLVAEDGVGIQLTPDCADIICAMTEQEHLAMRSRVQTVFDRDFSEQTALQTLHNILVAVLR